MIHILYRYTVPDAVIQMIPPDVQYYGYGYIYTSPGMSTKYIHTQIPPQIHRCGISWMI